MLQQAMTNARPAAAKRIGRVLQFAGDLAQQFDALRFKSIAAGRLAFSKQHQLLFQAALISCFESAQNVSGLRGRVRRVEQHRLSSLIDRKRRTFRRNGK
jgi:hypothetical protein